ATSFSSPSWRAIKGGRSAGWRPLAADGRGLNGGVCTGCNLNHFRRWMPGWLLSIGSGPAHVDASNATSTTKINQHERKGRQGEEDDRSRAVHTGSDQRGAGTKGRREVDAHSRQRTAPLDGKNLAGAYRSGASARVGSL